MRSWVWPALLLISRLENVAPDNQDGTDGDLAINGSLRRERDRALQEALVARIVLPARLERATPAFGGRYSIQLSYRSIGVGDGANDAGGVNRARPVDSTNLPLGTLLFAGHGR